MEPVNVLTEAENEFKGPKSLEPPPPPDPVATVTLKVELSPLVKVIVSKIAYIKLENTKNEHFFTTSQRKVA